jgi:prevent-host-death family protein
MILSVREAKARFAEAATAAANGEHVVITKHGKPFVEIVVAQSKPRLDWDSAMAIRARLAEPAGNADWFDDFVSNPAASRRVLGLDD